MTRRELLFFAPSLPLLCAPGQQTVYQVEDIALIDGLPRGAVSAWRVNARTGSRTLINRQPLSLSATYPRSVALSPDRRFLVAAAFGGGIYNVLALGRDGSIESITGIFKEVGCGPHPRLQTSPHPHSLAFTPDGDHIIATDLGCDRVTLFALDGGLLVKRATLQVQPGQGPAHLELAGNSISVRHALSGASGRYRYKLGSQPLISIL